MKILQLCYKPPYPPVDGGTLAMDSISQGLLAAGHEVWVLSVCSKKHPVAPSVADSDYARQTHFRSVEIDLSIHPVDAGIALLCGESYNVKRFFSKAFVNALRETLNDNTFDIVQVESIFLAPYLPTIRQMCKSPVVLRTHNVEHRIWEQMALGERRGLKRWYLKHLALALRHYEVEQLNLFDGIVSISKADGEAFRSLGCRKKMVCIPFGIVPPQLPPVSPEPCSLFHIGSMDWMPNREGVVWFVDKVWPLIHTALPQMKLYLAGRKMPEELLNMEHDGISVVGEVQDAAEFMATKEINVVPLLSGSGMRIKIIEAMAMGKPVVSTRRGASGIDYVEGEDLLLADSAEEFVTQIRRLAHDGELREKIGRNARLAVELKYSRQTLTQNLTAFYETLLQ